eukprot:gb/GECG01008858.1/.p1 GENE.gb/GECG01008858.1/~~gb/GECG01008858.1/.p1  ORF type:complete len:129 (+),score=7.70 gb/GECG01008858.1/:1-387(+)
MQKPQANAVGSPSLMKPYGVQRVSVQGRISLCYSPSNANDGQLSQVKTVAPHSSSPVYRYLGTVVSTIVTPLAENHTNVFHRAICTQLAPSSLTGPWVVTLSQAFTLIDRESDTIVTHVSLAQLVQCA